MISHSPHRRVDISLATPPKAKKSPNFLGQIQAISPYLPQVNAVGLPLAAKAAGKGTKCDPAETDYSIEDKYKRTPGSGTPALSTLLQKLSAIAMAAGGVMLLSSADFSKAF